MKDVKDVICLDDTATIECPRCVAKVCKTCITSWWKGKYKKICPGCRLVVKAVRRNIYVLEDFCICWWCHNEALDENNEL